MKKIIAFITLIIIVASCFGQGTSLPSVNETDYLRKSRNQKTAAWILLGGGTAMAVTGGVITAITNIDATLTLGDENHTGEIISIVGLLVAASSIPFFIASGKNKKRARASTSFRMENTPAIQRASIVHRSYPAVAIKILFAP